MGKNNVPGPKSMKEKGMVQENDVGKGPNVVTSRPCRTGGQILGINFLKLYIHATCV